MSKFAIFVTLKIKADKTEEFLAHAYANATAAVRDEKDCHSFRVLRNHEEPTTFHFFEVYTEAASLDAHRETVHYKAYNAAVGDMILEKSVTKIDVLQ